MDCEIYNLVGGASLIQQENILRKIFQYEEKKLKKQQKKLFRSLNKYVCQSIHLIHQVDLYL